MFVEVVDVVNETKTGSNGKSYTALTVTYRSNGKVAEKKIMSFAAPEVYKFFSTAQKGDSTDVVSVKNEKTGYWDWTAIGTGGGDVAQQSNPAATTATRVSGSNYETKVERAVRQRYIIRQSSVSSAIAALAVGAKASPKSGEIIELAKMIEEYVFSPPELLKASGVDSIEDDIPY